MRREQARDRFFLLYALGFPLGFALRWLDPPRALGIALAIIWFAATGWFGVTWLTRAVADGSLRRAVPDHLLAFLGLLVIAGLFALATVIVLLALGEDVTVSAASSGAALGTLAVVFAWPVLQFARRRRRRNRAGAL